MPRWACVQGLGEANKGTIFAEMGGEVSGLTKAQVAEYLKIARRKAGVKVLEEVTARIRMSVSVHLSVRAMTMTCMHFFSACPYWQST